jgi:hypothetical protein
VLDSKYRDTPAHPFALAQALWPGSYVSFETALSHHGWIPEAVHTIASVTSGRKSSTHEHNLFGSFSSQPLAIQSGYFLEFVERLQVQQQTMLVAKPIRALMDLVCLRKAEWQGLDWIVSGLRIEPDALRTITSADIHTLEFVYKQKRVKNFLKSFARELGHD